MVYGLRAQSPKQDWDQGSEEKAQGSEKWDQRSQGFWAQIRDKRLKKILCQKAEKAIYTHLFLQEMGKEEK